MPMRKAYAALAAVLLLMLLGGCVEQMNERLFPTPTPAPTPKPAKNSVNATPTPTPLPNKVPCVIKNIGSFTWSSKNKHFTIPKKLRIGPYNLTEATNALWPMDCYRGYQVGENIDHYYCSKPKGSRYKIVIPLETNENGTITRLEKVFVVSKIDIEANKTGYILDVDCKVRGTGS